MLHWEYQLLRRIQALTGGIVRGVGALAALFARRDAPCEVSDAARCGIPAARFLVVASTYLGLCDLGTTDGHELRITSEVWSDRGTLDALKYRCSYLYKE